MSSFGSSAINKSTRKFAPKAPVARRRPGATPASQPSQTQPVASARSSVDRQTPAPSSHPPSTLPSEATQALVTKPAESPKDTGSQANLEHPRRHVQFQDATTISQQTAPPSSAADAAATPVEAPPLAQTPQTTTLPQPTPQATPLLQPTLPLTPKQPISTSVQTPIASAVRKPSVQTTADVDDIVQRSPKRRRIDTLPSGTPLITPSGDFLASPAAATATAQLATPPATQQPVLQQPESSASADAPSTATEATSVQADTTAGSAPTTPAVQAPAAKKKRAPPKPKDKDKEGATRAKPKGKGKVADSAGAAEGEPVIENGVAPVEPARKTRKVRKDKGQPRKPKEIAGQATPDGEEGSTETPAPKPKRVQKPKAKTTPESEEGSTENRGSEARRGGRRREPTPEGAEDIEIAPDEVTMSDLMKSRNGKLSTREVAMRDIDWEAVNRRRKEALLASAQHNNTNNEEVNARLEEAGNARANAAVGGPRMRMVNGQIVLDDQSLVRDRHKEAQDAEENLEEFEEDDLTTRVNVHSWVTANRREPENKLMFPGNQKKWSDEQTEQFYNALRMFGTDFFLISKMFPGRTRRQIKMKFVREERADPARVKSALMGTDRLPMDFATFLQASGQTETDYEDPEKVERELAKQEEEHMVQIEKSREQHAEEMRQKKLAGVEDESGGEEGGKENRGKKKKKEKKKAKNATQGGDDVEVLETFDD